jgi:hypothetical protein
VTALHGTTMDGALTRKFAGNEFDSLANTHGFAVFYPDTYKASWNVPSYARSTTLDEGHMIVGTSRCFYLTPIGMERLGQLWMFALRSF